MVDSYYTQISEYPLLSAKEETLLAARALLGDKEAADRLVTGNLRFVVTVAKQYIGQGVPLEDLINEGNLGLMAAVSKFDPTKKYKFITYASYWIRQGILKALSEQNRTIRIPTNKIALLSKVRTATAKLTAVLERDPTQGEIEEYMGGDIDLTHIHDIQDRPIELDGSISTSEDDSRNVSDIIQDTIQPSPDELMKPEMFIEELERLLAGFTERERDIIYLYYGIGTGNKMTLEQLGHLYGICRERVRQIKQIRHTFIFENMFDCSRKKI